MSSLAHAQQRFEFLFLEYSVNGILSFSCADPLLYALRIGIGLVRRWLA